MADLVKIDVTVQQRKTRVRQRVEERTFDAVDTKGRRFGATASLFTVEYARETWELWPSSAERVAADPSMQREPGLYYGFYPQATRGGVRFGASNREPIFATAEERDAAAAKYLAEAEARALKNKARAR